MFDALEVSLQVLDSLARIEEQVRRRRKSLADEIGRAGESIALNLGEGRGRSGLDRIDFFRKAGSSAGELTTALRIARARRYAPAADLDAVEAKLDRVRAMCWRLTH